MAERGEGMAKDLAEALKWTRKAAEQGNADAQCHLGALLAQGNGVRKDGTEAVQWYRKAAEQGLAQAQALLGSAYLTGDGVARSEPEAYVWFLLAKAGGDAASAQAVERMEKELSPEAVAEGQKRASETWKKKP